MKIAKGIEIIDLGLFLKKENILILADTHVGYEESLNKQGILIPRFLYKDTMKRLGKLIPTGLDMIIVNGDIKHEFGTISEEEWRNTLKLVDYLSSHCKELVLVKGNHDKILTPIAEKRKIKIVDNVLVGDKLIIHGDKLAEIPTSVKTIIIGHEHPAVSLSENNRAETYKCFLRGKFKGKTLIVQPSFNLVTEGTDVKKSKLLSPFLEQDISDFKIFIVSKKEVLRFGKLKGLS